MACVVNYYGPSDFTKSYGKSVDAAEVLPLFLGGNLENGPPAAHRRQPAVLGDAERRADPVHSRHRRQVCGPRASRLDDRPAQGGRRGGRIAHAGGRRPRLQGQGRRDRREGAAGVLRQASEEEIGPRAERLVRLLRRQLQPGSSGPFPAWRGEGRGNPTPLQVKAQELWTSAFPHGSRLRHIIDQITDDLSALRLRVREHGARYLASRRGRLLDPLSRDVGEWRLWVEQVRRAANTAVQRYEREYLGRSMPDDFQDARDAILAALPIPDGTPIFGRFSNTFAFPTASSSRPPASTPIKRRPAMSMSLLLDRIREQLVDSLIVTVSGRRGRGGFWGELHQSLSDPKQLKMDAVFEDVRSRQLRELRTRQRDIYERMDVRLSRSPSLLWSVRAARIGIDIVAVCLAGWLGYQFWETAFGSSPLSCWLWVWRMIS